MKENQTLQRLCYKSAAYLKRHSSTILTCVGALGVIATAVTAAKSTPKAMRLLEKAKDEKGEDLTKLEVVKTAAPAYIPTAVIGVSTIACVFGANVLNKRHQAALVSAYALADNAYKEYRNKVKELLGEETDDRICEAIAIDKCEDIDVYVPGYRSLDTNGEKYLFYDEHSRRYFEKTIEAVQNAEYHLNRNYSMRGSANLNEFYEFLGLEPTKEGEVLGWDCSKMIEEYEATWIDFDHRLVTVSEDGLECYFISTPIPPSLLEEE